MKIEKIILKNFAAIDNAMNAKELTIDFSKSINKICLLIGPNGCGKTTLLSLLTPFSGLGNLDKRDKLNLILENKEGYKEIHISDNGNYYIIKHFYTPQKDKNHSVKSYISKNDNELNINGNVTSFKEYVKEELGIETDYLKLIRLGSNVTSMIELSETERKTFMSKLLDEIGVFLSYYKKVNNDLHQLKEMISHTIDKIDRLGIDNKKEIKESITSLKIVVEKEQERYGELSGLLSIYKHDIEYIKEPLTLKDELSSSVKKLNKMEKILEKKDDYESTDPKFYADKINSIEKDIIKYNTQIDSFNILISNYLTELDKLFEKNRELSIQLQKERDNDKELNKITEEQNKIRLEINNCEDNLGDFSPNYTKSEFDSFIVFLKNSQQSLSKTYEFGSKPIKKVISLLKEKKNVMQYINTHIMNIDEHEDDNSLFLSTIARKIDFSNSKPVTDCKNDCIAKTLYIEIKNLLENNQNDKKEKHDLSFYKDMEYVYQNIKNVLSSFADYKDIITKLPDKYKNWFLIDNIYSSIEKLEYIYDEKEMNDLYSLVVEYDDYLKLIDTANILATNYDRYSKLSNSSYVANQLDETNEQIDEYNDKISSLKKSISDLTEDVKSNKKTLESLYDLKETFEKYDELRENTEKLNNDYNIYKTNMEHIKNTEIELQKCKMNIDYLNEKIQEQSSNLNQYITLKNELKKFNNIYDEMTLTKEALSSKKGMSLYYIKNYLGNTEEITNELLDIAYDGKIYIDNFCITPTEFTMPFYNKGKLIKDVKYASQGEISFLSIALSFGLASQALSKYNIMLLDEIDGPLDTKNREKFIKILENQIDRIGSEQSFLITHNDMFSSYPVDIIDLSFSEENNHKYELSNYIPVIRK